MLRELCRAADAGDPVQGSWTARSQTGRGSRQLSKFEEHLRSSAFYALFGWWWCGPKRLQISNWKFDKNPRMILHFCSVTGKGDDNPRWQDITSYAFLIRATSTVNCRRLDVVCCLGWILPLWSEARGAVICGLLKNIEHLLFQQHAHQKHPVHARRFQLKSAIECCCGCGLFCPCLHRSRALRADPLGVTSVRSQRMNGKVGTPLNPRQRHDQWIPMIYLGSERLQQALRGLLPSLRHRILGQMANANNLETVLLAALLTVLV